MDHLDLAGVIMSTPMNWNLPLFDQQDAIYLSSSRQMLEPILEETSEDEEHAQNSWSPYEQTTTTSFWSGSASESETGSVIRIEINKDADSISERDFACPAKRPRRSDEFQQHQYQQQQNSPLHCSLDDTVIMRRPHVQRPEYVSESSMSSLERFLAFEVAARDSLGGGAANGLQRSSTGSTRRFEEFSADPDSVSYQSLSRSSSLIQFESLERQLTLQEQHASMSSLGNSSPSVLSFEGGVIAAGSNSGSNSGNNSRRGSQSSLLKQRFETSDGRLHQTYYDLDKLNFDDDETSTAPMHKQCLMLFGGNLKTIDSGNQATTFRSGSDSESSTTSSGSGNSVLNSSTKPSAEDLSDTTTFGKSMRITAFQRGGKNSAENLSEDSGYCEPSNLRRSKSKSIPKNFEKFCEEEEDYGQTSYEHDFAPTTELQHSKTNRETNDENVDIHNGDDDDDDGHDEEENEDDDDGDGDVSGDMCQPKINDVTFIVMESATQANATDRSATVIPPPPSYPPPSPPPLLETSFDALVYTTTPSCATAFARVKNSPKRDIAATSTSTSASTAVSSERAHRSIAHSPSPVASDISARSSTSTTPSTCASAASFTWYAPTQMHSQSNESSADEEAPPEDELGGAASASAAAAAAISREFSTVSFSLRNSLPDLREAYGSVSENTLFFSNPQRPTNGGVLEQHSAERSSEEIGGAYSEEEPYRRAGAEAVFRSENRESDRTSHSTTPEEGDVTADSAFNRNRPELKSRRRSVGVEGGSRIFGSDFPYKKRVSSVPSELYKVGRKKSRKKTRYNRNEPSSSSSSSSSSSPTSSESEDQFSVQLNDLRRCCSWSERRQKFHGSAKRRPQSLFGYINASYQDLTQLDYAAAAAAADGGKNQSLLKRACNSEIMSEKRRSAGIPEYEHLICKGNFLLDELSEIYDRNVSILNDRPSESVAEFDEDFEETMFPTATTSKQKPLHIPRPPPRHRRHSQSHSSAESLRDQDIIIQHAQLTIRKPPARRKHKSNTNSLNSEIEITDPGAEADADADVDVDVDVIPTPVKTFDQDPTNLRTSYAQSLEKCNFDPKELSNTDLMQQQQTRTISKRRFHSQVNNSKKKNLVSSTPNLNAYDHGAEAEDELEDEMFVSSAHTSMHQLPQSGGSGGGGGARAPKPLGILLPAGSRTSFGKEVSFCPVVSKYSWQEQSSEEMNEQTKDHHNEIKRSGEQGDQMVFKNYKEKNERYCYDDDDLLFHDIDATLAYNTKENEVIVPKQEKSLSEQLAELSANECYYFDQEHEKRVCERFIEELRENELTDGSKRTKERKYSIEEQQAITLATTPPNIVTSTKLVSSSGLEKTTTIITKRLMPSTSNEAIANATAGSTGALDEVDKVEEVSHKTTFVSETTATPEEYKTNEPNNSDVFSVENKIKLKTGQAPPRPLSIQLPILSEPPINRAHHILYASQQMLDNYQKREREAELQEQSKEQQQQIQRLKAASANNLSCVSGGTMSKQIVSAESQHSTNNNNDLSKMKSKFKADEKHPNSKGFLSRFAHGLRFSLRRNKKKQLQKDQQQQQHQQEQHTKQEFVPELQFNVVKDTSKKEKESKSKKKTTAATTTTTTTKQPNNINSKNTLTGKRGKSPDYIHIPLKGPLPAGSHSSANTSFESSASVAENSTLDSSNVSNASTVNVEQSFENGCAVQTPPTVDTKAATAAIAPKTKLVTGKPPLPKQPPPPRTSSLPQNVAHAHHHQQHQQQKQYAPAVAIATSFVPKHQPQQSDNDVAGLPNHYATLSDSCEDFLAAERSYYYDDFKNQLNSGMQANGCTLATATDSVGGGIVVSSPSRGSVSQKTQMFNNLQRGSLVAAPVSVPVSVSVSNHNHHNHQNQNAGKIGLIETNLDTHETIITGKTRSLVDIGPSQLRFVNAGGKRLNFTSTGAGGNGGNNVLIYDDDDDEEGNNGDVVDVKTTTAAGQIASVRRPHKSMEFLLDKENQKNVLPPENELQKSHEHNPAALSEHQLRIQASLQRLNIPDWFRQYNQTQTPETGTTGGSTYKPGNFTRKRTQESGRWAGLNSKTTSLSSLGSHRSDRSPLLLSPSAHSHHGGQTTNAPHQPGHTTSVYSTAAGAGSGTGGSSGGTFSRWSTSQLNSSQTSPSVSQRCSFSRGGPINSSFMSVASSGTNNSIIRNSFRQPYLGWRSTEKLSQRTAHERLASSMLAQQQRTSPTQRPANSNIKLQQQQQQQQPVTPEIQSSIKEVTSAIVHYVNDQTNQQRSRSTSPNSRKCWLESSFVGVRPLDSPQTPIIETAGNAFNVAGVSAANNLTNSNSNFSYNNQLSVALSTHPHNTISHGIAGTTTSSSIGLTTNAANVLRMNGLSLSGGGESAILI